MAGGDFFSLCVSPSLILTLSQDEELMDDEVLPPPAPMPNLSANYGNNRDRDRPPSSVKKNIMSNKNNIQDGDDEFDF